MSINKCFFEFHLFEQGWLSTPPSREDGQKLRLPGASIVTLRMIEFGSGDKPDVWYKTEVDHIDSNRVDTRELLGSKARVRRIALRERINSLCM
jgi:hypothetical protein